MAGFCAAWLCVCLAFAFHGALQPLLDDVVWANLAHYPSQPKNLLLYEARLYFDEMPLVWVIPLLLVVAFCLTAVLRRRMPGLASLGDVCLSFSGSATDTLP